MSSTEPWRLIAVDLAEQIADGSLSATEAVEASLSRIEAVGKRTNAIVTVCGDQAREAAERADRAAEEGRLLGPLHGVPVAVKDLDDHKAGVRNTFGSVPFAEWVPRESGPVVERLEAAGAIVVGKTNTPEFGHKGATDNDLFGPTSTPFDLERNAGGSSGGSAAAVSDGLVPLATGSDRGGSIRIPAAFCNVVGLKASFGRVPSATGHDRFGHHTPMDHKGPLARTVADAALLLEVMTGPHPSDPFTLPAADLDLVGAVDRGIEGRTVAYSRDLAGFPIEPEVGKVVEQATYALEDAGAVVREVDLGLEHDHEALFEALTVCSTTASAAMVSAMGGHSVDLLEDHADELSWTFKAIIERGQATSAVELRRTGLVRTELDQALHGLFQGVDLLVTPTTGIPPFPNDPDGDTLGPKEVQGQAVDPTLGWALTYPFNLTGHPAASVPAGVTDDGLPVGLQIVGPRLADEAVVAAAGALEKVRPWVEAYPWA